MRFIQFSAAYIQDPPDPANLRPSRVALAKGSPKYPSTPISHYPGVGRYALDSFRIYSPLLPGGGAHSKERKRLKLFKKLGKKKDGRTRPALPPPLDLSGLAEEWRDVLPLDKELKRYLIWRWAIDGYVWDPLQGVVGLADEEYIQRLPHFKHCLHGDFADL